MNINRATRQYETWLGERLTLVPDDLTDKHTKMADTVFLFLRATFYRWAQEWPRVCAALTKAPAVLAVGDLHVENCGSASRLNGPINSKYYHEKNHISSVRRQRRVH